MKNTKEISVRTIHGIQKVRASIIGPLAVHGQIVQSGVSEQTFQITHLPSGFGFSVEFFCLADARKAALKIKALRDDWETFDPKTVSKKFLKAIRKIYDDCDGYSPGRLEKDTRMEKARAEYATDLNGYGPRSG
jgi:hypothetical protein